MWEINVGNTHSTKKHDKKKKSYKLFHLFISIQMFDMTKSSDTQNANSA